MFKIDWEAIRAYASPLILTIIALIAVWKDEKEYKKRAHEGREVGLVGGEWPRSPVTCPN